MPYLSIITAAGHRLMVDPKKQKPLLRDLQDAQVAEARISEKQHPYEKYRIRRGLREGGCECVFIATSVKGQLDRVDDATFRVLDAGIVELAKQPRQKGSKPEQYRWFVGDLRRIMVGEFPIVYTAPEIGERINIVNVGLRRWTHPPDPASAAKTRERGSERGKKGRAGPKRTKEFGVYSGETPEELFSLSARTRTDVLVQAFREGIQQKAERKGDESLTYEERVVLAVTALEQEVNNGGYDQFFRNTSRKFVPVVVEALKRIGRRHEAEISERAICALLLPDPLEENVASVMSSDSSVRDEELEKCDRLFFRSKGMADHLYSFIEANKERISFS